MLRSCIAALCLCLSACAGHRQILAPAELTPDKLLSSERIPLAVPAPADVGAWLEADDAMRQFVAQQTEGVPRDQFARRLLAAFPGRLDYQRNANVSAVEVFHDERANCLSFSAMAVSLLRNAGLQARFQRVVIPPHWELEGKTVVATLHVNTVVRLRGRDIEIDWARTSSPSVDDRKTLLSDEEALAELHNNLGTEALIQGQLPRAFAEFRRALTLAPATAHIWVNLGSLYARLDDLEAAEVAWLTALKHESRQSQALSSLDRLYRKTGRPEVAAEFSREIQRYQDRNPYHHFLLARQAMAKQQYSTAITHLQKAIERRDDPRFQALLEDAMAALAESPALAAR